MGTVDLISQGTRVQRHKPPRRLRAPWRRGAWSSAEAALALQTRRAELLRTLSVRGDARGLPAAVLEEVVSDAICIVVMMRRPIVSEEHLIGAFWTAARILLRQHREGRHSLRVGSRSRVGFEAVAAQVTNDDFGPEDVAALKDRVARAVDFVAQLNAVERGVVSVMAVRGAGIKLTARILGIPVKTAKAAQRSAQGKLDRVAVIAAAGRMCDYRERAITAYASGSADAEDEQVARAHLAGCAACRASYAQLMREMRSRAFQRDAAAALLPAPILPLGHHLGLLGRVIGWTAERPRFGTERAVEVLGGAGVVKAAAAGSAVVVATATLASGVRTTLEHHPPHPHRRAHVARSAPRPVLANRSIADAPVVAPAAATSTARAQTTTHLTPREHLEREFSSLPRSGTSRRTSERATASTAAVSSDSNGAEGEASVSSTSRSTAYEGPSAAAREFGQP
jgi:anti-sigma factor RsiW